MLSVGLLEILVIVLWIVSIWLFSEIFRKAGFRRRYALLLLVPVLGFLAVLAFLAFAPWPDERR